MQLSLTPRAAEAALSRARDAEVQGWLLRVAVVAGGCNGLTYDLFFVPEAGPEDAVVEAAGLRVAVDRASQNLLDNGRTRLRDDRLVAGGTVQLPDTRKEQSQIIIDFRICRDGRSPARSSHFLLDAQNWRQAINEINIRPVDRLQNFSRTQRDR